MPKLKLNCLNQICSESRNGLVFAIFGIFFYRHVIIKIDCYTIFIGTWKKFFFFLKLRKKECWKMNWNKLNLSIRIPVRQQKVLIYKVLADHFYVKSEWQPNCAYLGFIIVADFNFCKLFIFNFMLNNAWYTFC
jgi:hypothetical protein